VIDIYRLGQANDELAFFASLFSQEEHMIFFDLLES